MNDMGIIYARLISKGRRKFSQVPEKFKQATREAWLYLFGEEIDENA